MVNVGDVVRVNHGANDWEEGLVGIVEAVSHRYELRPYTTVVNFPDGACGVYSDEELEVLE